MKIIAVVLALIAFQVWGQDSIDFGPGGGSLPSQAGNSGRFLTTDGSNPSWAALAGGGDMAAATYDPGGVSGDAFARSNHTGTQAASTIGSGTFADGRISESSVTQHQGALAVTESQISDLGTYETADAAITKADEAETVTGAWDFGGGSLEIPNSASLPGTCDVGDVYMDTNATSGQRLYLCESSNTWAVQGDGGGGGGIGNVSEDTTPQLGGDLDINGNDIVSTSNGNIQILPNGTGDVVIGTVTWDADQSIGASQDGYFPAYDHSAGKVVYRQIVADDISDAQAGTFNDGLEFTGGNVNTKSDETGFLEDGGATSLTCGASAQGQMQVMDNGDLEFCDGATTSILRTISEGSGTNVQVDTGGNLSSLDFQDGGTINFAESSGVLTATINAGGVGSSQIATAAVGADEIGTDAVSASELDGAGVESELESLLDLSDLQGSVTDGQIPAAIARDSELPSTATTSAEGIVELATTAEATTGTDTARAVTPDALADSTFTDSAYWPGGSLTADGTQCADPAKATINSGPALYSVICTDNAASIFYGSVTMPDGYDGGTVTFELAAIQTAADTNVLDFDFSGQCRGDSDTVNSTWGTAANASITFATANDIEHATTAAVTPNGTCAAGDTLFWRAVMDNTATTTAVATAHIVGVKMEYTTVRGD